MAKFKYQHRDEKDWEDRANNQGGSFVNFLGNEYKTYAAQKGDNWIRFLPPTWEGARHYGLDIWVHYGIGPDRGAVLCLNKMATLEWAAEEIKSRGLGTRCPICEERVRAQRRGEDELERELRAGLRVVVWLVDMKDESKGPLLWAMPPTLDKQFSKLARDKRSGETLALDHPDDGYNVSFEKQGEKLNTKYDGERVDRKPSSIDERDLEFVIEHPLPTVLVWRDAEEVQKIFDGGVPPDEDKDERRGSSRRDPRPRDDDRDSGRSDSRDRVDSRADRGRDRDADEPRGRSSRDADDREGARPSRGRDRDEDRSRDREEPARGRSSGRDRDEDEERPARRSARDDRDEPEDKPKEEPLKQRGKRASAEKEPPPDDPDDPGPADDDREEEEPETRGRRAAREDKEDDTRTQARKTSADLRERFARR